MAMRGSCRRSFAPCFTEIVMNLLNDLIYSPGTLANLIVPSALLNLRTKAAILLIQEAIEGGPGRGEWPSGQKRQTVNLLKFST